MTTSPTEPDEPAPPEAEELVAYLDGELDPTEAEQVETRIGLDAKLRAEADAYRRTWDLLDYLPRPQPSADFTNRTLERIDALTGSRAVRALPGAATSSGRTGAGRPRRWLGAALGWAAVLLLAVAAGYGGRALVAPRPAAPKGEPREIDPQLLADLPVVENLRLYKHVDDLEFLKALDHPDLFGEER